MLKNMKVGQTIQNLGPLKPSDFMKMVNLLGIPHVEFDPSVFDDVEAVSKLIGHKSVTLHAPFYEHWGFDLSSKKQADKVDKYLTDMELHAETLKAHSVVIHPPMDPEGDPDFFMQSLNRVKITAYLENMIGQRLTDFETWYHETKARTSAKVEICFDVPHSFLTHGKDDLFDVPPSLIPDLKYIHISELTSESDCHWPFGTPGGELPFDKFEEFFKKIRFTGNINMEMMPSDIIGIGYLIDSFLKLQKLGTKGYYLRKKLRILLTKPLLMKKLKGLTIPSEIDEHN